MDREDFNKQVQAELAKLNPESAPVEAPETVSEAPVEAPVSEEGSSDPYLDEAIKMGFNPNYNGPNKKTAEQFVRDGSFFRKIDALKKQLDEQTEAMKLLVEHNKKKETDAYQRGIQEAIQRRREAVELGDVEAFNKAEAELNNLQQQKQAVPQVPVQSTVPNTAEVSQELKDFMESEKSWFNKNTKENEKMVIEADGLFTLESQYNPHLSQKEVLEIVKQKIRALHPEKFENQMKERPATVGRSTASATKQPASIQLTDRQRKVFEMARAIDPSLKIEDYAKQITKGV